jgi:hypothetical protein
VYGAPPGAIHQIREHIQERLLDPLVVAEHGRGVPAERRRRARGLRLAELAARGVVGRAGGGGRGERRRELEDAVERRVAAREARVREVVPRERLALRRARLRVLSAH